MKQILLKIFKVFLIITAVLLSFLVVSGIALVLGWPWWMGFFILLGLVGLWLGGVFLRKVWLSVRQDRFIHKVIEQDETYLKTLGDIEKERSRELQNRWKEAMEALKASHLKKYGNPLYVLPWYMVIGESGSGKTTAIQSARLSSPFAEISRTSGISGTRNCDWWFFEQAILIDTAGRYAIPVDEGRDKEEWENFLILLAKFRKKEPLNGLVVTVAADKLLDATSETLEDDGKSIRRRIDELMRVLGAKFPVYVLVTKCDLIQGMNRFCEHLPEKSHDQAMGFMNQDRSTDVTSFLKRGMYTMGERLRDLRLLLSHKPERRWDSRKISPGIDPGLLIFPEEFERLTPGLNAFIRGAFQENPYQETPILRGLFYSSGRQEGTPYSHFLQALGLIEEREVLPGTSKGLFLHDFFSRILPRDRALFAPTQRRIEWSRLTRNLGLTAWLALTIALCGLLSFSFVKNLRTLREISHEFSKPTLLQGEILTDVITMDRFREAVLRVEDQNRNWWIPRFGLNESKAVEIRLKDKYCKQFHDGFLTSFDKQMADRMANFSRATPDEIMGRHVAHLVRRINLLRACIQGEDLEALRTRPQPSYGSLLLAADEKLIPEIRKRFVALYLYYLAWRKDSTRLNQEMNNLQTWLKHVLTLKGTNLNWLTAWVNSSSSISPITLEDFWGGSLPPPHKASILPAFTLSGKKQIDLFVKEMEAALFEPLILARRKLEFEVWYKERYIEAWHDFGAVFPEGSACLKGRKEWQPMAAQMARDQGPYFSLLDRMAAEFKPFALSAAAEKELPSWINLVYAFKAAGIQAASEETARKKTILGKATEKGKEIISTLEKKATGLQAEKTLESELIAGKALYDYQSALNRISPVSLSKKIAFQMTSQAYKEDPDTGESPFFEAWKSLNRLRASLLSTGTDNEIFWNLVSGPLDFLWTFVSRETACHLQELWEREVLVEVQGVRDSKIRNQLLFGQEGKGYAIKFVKGPAAPFVSRSLKKGYYAREKLGRTIPFKNAFFTFIYKGTLGTIPEPEPEPVKDNYMVSIKGLPTDVNRDAQIGPHATRLELNCVTGLPQILENYNDYRRKVFNWSPDSCGDVIFKIEVANLVLIRKYTGDRAFAKFLKDFRTGRRTFYPGDFPEEKATLKRLGIKFIKVNYQFQGHKPVIDLIKPGKRGVVVPKPPENIVTCWDQ